MGRAQAWLNAQAHPETVCGLLPGHLNKVVRGEKASDVSKQDKQLLQVGASPFPHAPSTSSMVEGTSSFQERP